MASSSFDISDTMNAISNNDIHEYMDDVIFEHINDDYAWSKYMGDFNVMIMKENGYINASKICSENSKLIAGWTRGDFSKRLISDLTEDLRYVQYCTISLRSERERMLPGGRTCTRTAATTDRRKPLSKLYFNPFFLSF
jgi:hypothetical protein